MKHVLAFVLFLGAAAWAGMGHTATQTSDFRFFAEIQGQMTPGVPARMSLPGEVIAATSRNFSDLRLFDDAGLEIPYAISEQNELPRTTFTFNILSYRQNEEQEEIVIERPPNTATFQEVAIFTSARNFKKAVEVQASDDLVTWRPLAADVIFDFSARVDLRKITVEVPEANVAYLKLLLRDDTTPISSTPEVQVSSDNWNVLIREASTKALHIDRVEGHSSARIATAQVFDHLRLSNFAVTVDQERKSLVQLGRVNLPLTSISLTIDNPYYYRRVSLWAADTDAKEEYRQVATGLVYKIPGMNAPENTLDFRQPQRPFLRLEIINDDNPPLRLQQVDLAWERRNLYFIPESGRRYFLYFSNEQIAAPDYELTSILAHQSATPPFRELTTGAVQENPAYHPSLARGAQERIEKTVLVGMVLLLAGVMGVWVYRLMKNIPARSNPR